MNLRLLPGRRPKNGFSPSRWAFHVSDSGVYQTCQPGNIAPISRTVSATACTVANGSAATAAISSPSGVIGTGIPSGSATALPHLSSSPNTAIRRRGPAPPQNAASARADHGETELGKRGLQRGELDFLFWRRKRPQCVIVPPASPARGRRRANPRSPDGVPPAAQHGRRASRVAAVNRLPAAGSRLGNLPIRELNGQIKPHLPLQQRNQAHHVTGRNHQDPLITGPLKEVPSRRACQWPGSASNHTRQPGNKIPISPAVCRAISSDIRTAARCRPRLQALPDQSLGVSTYAILNTATSTSSIGASWSAQDHHSHHDPSSAGAAYTVSDNRGTDRFSTRTCGVPLVTSTRVKPLVGWRQGSPSRSATAVGAARYGTLIARSRSLGRCAVADAARATP